MPLTPLHFGLLAPINHWLPGKVNPVSFALVTLWIDAPFIAAALADQPLPSHGAGHSFIMAMTAGVIVAMPGVRSMAWVVGAYLAALSHVLLDSLVHSEMQPYFPHLEDNPLYLGIMEPLSLALLPLMIWFIAQSVSWCVGYLRRGLARWTDEPGPPGP